MGLPFTTEQFFTVFARYNAAVWPWQFLLALIAPLVVFAAVQYRTFWCRVALVLLALLWLWMAAVYHLGFFSNINPAAYGFAFLFAANAALLLWLAVRRRMIVEHASRFRTVAAAGVIGYSLLVYPAIGYLAGHRYPAAPTFGLPCRTTIFTLGVLCLMARLPRVALVIPIVWAVIGSFAALQLHVPQDYGLIVAAAVTVSAIFLRVTKTGNPPAV